MLTLWALMILGVVPALAENEIRLEDPRTGHEVTVEPGAAALHVVFFATWCPPCVAELDRLSELKARWGDRSYRLVIVAVETRHTASRLADFADGRDFSGELLFDADGRAERTWNAAELPTHIVFDASGNETARSGALDDGIETALDRLLSVRRGAGVGAMTAGRKVALIFGGPSVEHQVSVDSARGVAAAMASTDLECVPIGVTSSGRWLDPSSSLAIIDGGQARVEAATDDGPRVAIEPGSGGLVLLEGASVVRPLDVDAVFPLIHGWGGEDGRLQGALELAGVPYVGAGVLGSAAGMDKAVAKQLFEAQGLPGVPWMEFHRESWERTGPRAHRRIESELGFPVFVKPANGGSSVGISRVDRAADIEAAMAEAFECDEKVVVERGLDAREIEVAVLGNDTAEASVPGEVIPSREFYDYGSKYLDGTSELKIPAPLDPDAARALRAHAISAYRCLGLAGFARVDFLLERGSGQAYLNEVNTLPGFTPISMFPKLWEASGLAYSDLIVRLVDLALERWRTESRRRTTLKES